MINVQDEIIKKLEKNNRVSRNQKKTIQPQIKIHYI